MRLLIVAALVVAVTARLAPLSEREYQSQFVEYIQTFNKEYPTDQFFAKFSTFKYWVDYVRHHNAGNNTWEAGINEFSDLSPEEFNQIYLTGLEVDQDLPVEPEEVDMSNVPNDIDWRSQGAVNPVKNQGQCGSCWAFSATGTMEGFTKVKGGSLPNLSEQQLVDCAGSAGNHGCSGGWPSSAIKWVASNGGSCAQQAYPYTGRDGTCKKGCAPVAKVSGARSGAGEASLASNLGSMPISIALDASGGFQSYKSGVFSGPCGTQLNHAVLAVGFNAQYWIVKNSWGSGWGSGGYIFMSRGKNLCGLGNVLAWPN
jgi:C1A family cysteine protease